MIVPQYCRSGPPRIDMAGRCICDGRNQALHPTIHTGIRDLTGDFWETRTAAGTGDENGSGNAAVLEVADYWRMLASACARIAWPALVGCMPSQNRYSSTFSHVKGAVFGVTHAVVTLLRLNAAGAATIAVWS